MHSLNVHQCSAAVLVQLQLTYYVFNPCKALAFHDIGMLFKEYYFFEHKALMPENQAWTIISESNIVHTIKLFGTPTKNTYYRKEIYRISKHISNFSLMNISHFFIWVQYHNIFQIVSYFYPLQPSISKFSQILCSSKKNMGNMCLDHFMVVATES